MGERPAVPAAVLDRLRAIASGLPECHEEAAWVGTRWVVARATVAHVFGGEEVLAFPNLGPPYFRAGWGSNVIGVVLDDTTDWDEVGELVTISYCIQAPRHLAARVDPNL